ncbi:MAG TPA: PilW family protein [Usitatibacter sp.]|nr:PilW family protein [Usitatibacter sp.]
MNLRKRVREAGFTLVEMMVGVLIGMIAIVVMFQVFAISEGQKRTTAGASDAQQEGASSSYLIERDGRMAGYGMNYFPLYGCNVWGYWNPSGKAFNFTLAPAIITKGAATVPDKLVFAYAGTDTVSLPASLVQPTGSTPGYFDIGVSTGQFLLGDLVVFGEVPAALPLKDCSLFQATSYVAGDSSRIRVDSAFYVDDAGATRSAQYTPPTASTTIQPAPHNQSYAKWTKGTKTGGRVFTLGKSPTVVEYSVVNNQLVYRSVLNPDDPGVAIADNIVQFKAQYGIAENNPAALDQNGVAAPTCLLTTTTPCRIDASTAVIQPRMTPASPQTSSASPSQWVDDLPAAPYVMKPDDWRRIIAVRFVIVARSNQKERTDPVTGVCTATTVMPVWTTNNGTTLDVSADPDWRCYRYKTFEAVAALRNMMWFPDPSSDTLGSGAEN